MKNLKLKSARAAKDLSQDELAKLCGVSRQTISSGLAFLGRRSLRSIPGFLISWLSFDRMQKRSEKKGSEARSALASLSYRKRNKMKKIQYAVMQ